MAKFRHLKNAPIKEAIIDIKIEAPSPLNPEIFSGISGDLGDNYSEEGQLRQNLLQFEIGGEDETVTTNDSVIGYRYSTEDERFVAQFTNEGFSLSHLPKYTNWETFKAEAERVWSVYSALVSGVVGDFSFARIATRYINEIPIPIDINQTLILGDYLSHPPTYPRELGDTVNNFFSKISLPISDLKAVCTINQLLGHPDPEQEVLPVILDTDVYRQPCNDLSIREVWDCLDNLRNYKNKVFFNMITDKTAEMFE